MEQFTLEPEPDTIEETGTGPSLRRFAVYDVHTHLDGDTLDIEATYKSRHIYGITPAPDLHVSRFVTGTVVLFVTGYC